MPGIATRQHWQEWSCGQRSPVPGENPSLDHIPPLLRRRLSPLGKIALAAAWPVLPADASLPSLFCSRHGELERTVAMLRDLANGESLSPTHFSLSVHNAIGGVYSIARGDSSAITALAVGEEGLSQALLETRLILAEQQAAEALCVIYDAPLPDVYSDFGREPEWPYACAFVVGLPESSAGSHRLSLQLRAADECPAASPEPIPEPQALRFVRFLLQGPGARLRLPMRNDCWEWTAAEPS